ncbi:hypothetical protein PM082_006869 [Marasmius tenuissimus]|nr:hypothetical protein PM082_006869 [Marasmius tenuissimus]
MRFTSSSLPLHHEHGYPRRVGFEDEPRNEESLGSRIRHKLRKLAYIAIHASTGSPSDGLGGDGTESTTSTPAFIASQKLITAEKDGEDWKVDEVVVAGGDVDHWKRVESERGTTTGGSPGQSDADSVRNERLEAWRDSPSNMHYSPSVRTRVNSVWISVKYFFDSRFEDEAAEMDFKKLNWYSSKAL